jgi:protein-tyrosine phosphatase
MVQNYRSYLRDAASRAGFASLFSHLVSDPGPQLFHCAAGKDRTGWAAELVQHIAGVDRSTILED